MKKAFILVLLSFITSSIFCEVFANSEKIVEDFFNKGKYIKIIKNDNNIYYYSKDCIAGISVDEDDIKIASMGYDIWTGHNGDSVNYSTDKWSVSSDDNSNIIITRN